MFQTLALLVLFIAAVAALPWLLRRWQQRQSVGRAGGGPSAKVLSTVAVGPTKRVVTVEVGDAGQRACLVLGVTAQHIQCLHVLASTSTAAGAASFAGTLAAAQAPASPAHPGAPGFSPEHQG